MLSCLKISPPECWENRQKNYRNIIVRGKVWLSRVGQNNLTKTVLSHDMVANRQFEQNTHLFYMKALHSHRYSNTPFRVTTETIENAPGTWNSTKISIYKSKGFDIKDSVYREEILLGEYIRNYHAFNADTFYPFEADGEWYALYSAEYTATRVMKLYEDRIEDWCGEEPNVHGFCPTEYYVPRVVKSQRSFTNSTGETVYDSYGADCDMEGGDFRELIESPEFCQIDYCKFGFLSGCVWGDDTSWKVRYVDLSKVPEKILSITDKFGYWKMPGNLTLKKCVDLSSWEPGHNWISLTGVKSFNLNE